MGKIADILDSHLQGENPETITDGQYHHIKLAMQDYAEQKIADAFDAGAKAVRNAYESSGKYLLYGSDVSKEKEQYLNSLNK